MKKVNTQEFVSYTITGPGWSVLIHDFNNAKREWNNINKAGCNFIGNRRNGSTAILDTK